MANFSSPWSAPELLSVGQCLAALPAQALKDFSSLIYLLKVAGSIKEHAEGVPNYEILLFPAILLLAFFEQLVRLLRRQELSRFEEVLINVGSALLFSFARFFLYVRVFQAFDYLHSNFRLLDLPQCALHSVSSWLATLLLLDLAYYWVHRAMHEVNFLWAAHVFHHMAEDVNVTTAVRNSALDLLIYGVSLFFIFYFLRIRKL